MKRFNMNDIAKLSGYSIATVSRVLNRSGRYSAEAEKKIRAIAEEHDFRPDALAQGMKRVKSRTFGILVPDMEIRYYMMLAQRIQEELVKQDYFPVHLRLGSDGFSAERAFSILRTLNVAGLIFISCTLDRSYLEELNVPAVFVNRFFTDIELSESQRYSSIQPDYRQAGILAAQELARKGCHTVSYMRGLRKTDLILRLREQSFISFAEQLGLTYIPAEETEGTDLMSAGYSRARETFRLHPELDGIFCENDTLGAGALAYFRDAGIPVPDRMQIVGLGREPDEVGFFYQLTSIRLPADSVAVEAASMIIGMTESSAVRPREVSLHMSLHQGKTTRP